MVINAGNYVSPLESGAEVRLNTGVRVGYIEETVIPDGSATYDLAYKLPIGAIVENAEIKLTDTVATTTAVKIGLGRKDGTADPDKYAITDALVAGNYSQSIITVTGVLADSSIEETLQVVACDVAGTLAGTLNSGGHIVCRINYKVYESLD